MDSKICLLSLKFDSNNIGVAKRLTTEEMSLQDRIAFVRERSMRLVQWQYVKNPQSKLMFVF